MNHISRCLLSDFLRLFAFSLAFVLFLLSLVNMFQAVELLVGNLIGFSRVLRYWLLLLAYLLPYALGLAALVAVIITFSRFAQDRELTAVRGLGIPFRRVVLPLLGAGLLISLANLGAAGFLQPYGRYQARILRHDARLLPGAGLLRPGSIVTHFPGITIFVPLRHQERNVTVFHKEAGLVRAVSARRVRLTRDGAEFHLFLEEGFMQIYDPSDPETFQKLSFETYRFPLPRRPGAGLAPSPRLREKSSAALAAKDEPRARIEQNMRFSIAFAPFVFMLAGITIGASLPRTAWGVIAACGIVLAYHLLLSGLEFAAQARPGATHLILLPNLLIFSLGALTLRN